jgi:drug/metabolite transporter (DMT)-like permease
MLSYLVPVAALILAFVVLGERPLPVQLVGAAVIIIGVRLAARTSLPSAKYIVDKTYIA